MAGSAIRQGLYGDDAYGTVDVLAGWAAVRVLRRLIRAFTDEAV